MIKKNKLILSILSLFSVLLICFSIYIFRTSVSTLKISSNAPGLSFDKQVKFSSHSSIAIGIRQDVTSSATSYRSLIINCNKDSCTLQKQFPYIIVLNNKGIFKLEPIRFDYDETMDYVQYIAVHKNNETYSPMFMEYNQDTFSSKLVYVNEDIAALENYRVVNGEKNNIINEVSVVKLEDIPKCRNSNVKINIKDILPETASLIENLKNTNKDGIITITDGSNWTITREKGLWVPKLAETFQYYNSYTDYKLQPLPDKSNEKFNHKSYIKIEEIKKLFPEALDFIASKDTNSLIVFFPKFIKVYPIENNKIGNDALTIELNPNEKMIMYKWLDDKILSEINTIN